MSANLTAERLITARSHDVTGGLQRSTERTRHIVRRDIAVWPQTRMQW